MTHDEAYLQAAEKIEEAGRSAKTELFLRGMNLTTLPESIGKLTHLRVLDISNNQLSLLPDTLCHLEHLQSLSLHNNQFTALPEWLGHFRELRSFTIYATPLESLPDSFGELEELKSLNLGGNRIKLLPQSIGRLAKLQKLLLSGNRLTDLPDSLAGLRELQLLYLTGNQLSSLPDCVGDLITLTSLLIGRNQLTALPDAVGNLSSLEKLTVKENRLTYLPDSLGNLLLLKHLDVSSNQLATLPASLGSLDLLQLINLKGNPLTPELSAADDEGIDAIKRFLRARTGSQVALNEAKLILIGEGEVGKSCVLGALRGDAWVEKRDTTHGIEIKPVSVYNIETGAEMTLNGWDFGGQRVYRPTHQLFFSAPAVYLVVWKPREGPQQGFVKEWIKLIMHREPEAKILVVATHGGPRERQPDIDRQELWDLFGRDTIVDFFHVDSRPDPGTGNCLGIDSLKMAIARVAASLPEMGRSVPKNWQEARLELKSIESAHITTAKAVEICEKHHMAEEDANLFLTIEHRLGQLIHYGNDETLRDIVVLKPDWLATAISLILDDKQTRNAHGLVSFHRLGELWDDPTREPEFRYAPALHPVFVRLMERYDLSYRVASLQEVAGNEGTYLIAQLVPDVKPENIGGWSGNVVDGEVQQTQICRITELQSGQSATAEGLFYQLIVRLHKFSLGRQDFRQSSHWQRGLVLDDDYNGRALLEHIGNDVRISVRAAYPEAFLSVLTHEVKWLVESFWKGMRCDVMVPCLSPNSCTGLFEVRKLIENKKRNRPEQPCPICNEWQSIDALLHNAPAARPSAALELQVGYHEFRDELSGVRALLLEQHGVTMNQFLGLNVMTLRLLSKVDDAFQGIMTALTDEAKEGPRLFSIEPVDPGFFDKPKWISQKFRVTLWCEHSRMPVWALSDGEKEGVYELDVPRDWFLKAAPFLKVLATTLSLALPVASAVTKVVLDDATFKGIEKNLDLSQKSVDSLVKGGEKVADWLVESDAPDIEAGALARADGAVLRELHSWLKEKDPGFGGLLRVQNKQREFVWVHPQFAGEY